MNVKSKAVAGFKKQSYDQALKEWTILNDICLQINKAMAESPCPSPLTPHQERKLADSRVG